jgi:hypothetical protein
MRAHLVLRTPGQRDRCGRVRCAIGSSRTRLALWPPWSFFSTVRESSDRPADRSLTHPHSAGGEKELGPLGVGGPWPLFEIFYEQPPGLLVQLRSPAGGLRRLQGAALVELFTVAFYGGAIYPETAGGQRPLGCPFSQTRRSSLVGQANMHSCINDTRRTVIAICCQNRFSASFWALDFSHLSQAGSIDHRPSAQRMVISSWLHAPLSDVGHEAPRAALRKGLLRVFSSPIRRVG